MNPSAPVILAVDDEPNNLRALRLDLEDENYQVLTAANGQEGWDILQQHRPLIKAILLDRMMPVMNGMEFIAKAKETAETARIPIIMQTAAAERSQMMEGIKAGVYYYLTKPYDKDLMLSIVRAAVMDYGNYSKLRDELQMFKSKLHLVRESNFEVRTLEDAHYLATFIAQFFPDPERVVFGINELLLNAIEHGNLAISYDEKTDLCIAGTLRQEIKRRQALPDYASRKVLISYQRREHEINLIIRDEGAGFDWQNYMEISPERATHNHGRGIALSRLMSFDALEYRGKGNEVCCRITL